MFQNKLFNNIKNEFHIHFLKLVEFIFDFVYVFESARIKCIYAAPHMNDYPLIVKYYQLRSQICLSMHVYRKLTQANQNMWPIHHAW